MAAREQNPEQIVRIDGKNCFLEVMTNSFAIGKVRINFRAYDKNAQQGSRMTSKIDMYLNFKDFDYIYQGVMNNGYLMGEVYNNQYGATIHHGGKKENGKVIARELKLQVGQKKPFVLIAEQGPGSENQMGGYALIRGNNATIERIMIPLEFKDLIHICVSTNNAIIAFRAAEETKKTMDFEFAKVKDMLALIAQSVGCNQNSFMEVYNREMPKQWKSQDSGASAGNENTGGNYAENYGGQQNQYSGNTYSQGYDPYYGGYGGYN